MVVHRYLHASRWNWWNLVPTDSTVIAFNALTGTNIPAINTMVTSLKASSIWDKLTDIYPFVGTTSSSQAVNLKTPGTNSLSFVNPGGATFSGGYNSNAVGTASALNKSNYINSLSLTLQRSGFGGEESRDFSFGTTASGLHFQWSDSNLYSDLLVFPGQRLIANGTTARTYVGTRSVLNGHKIFLDGVAAGSQTIAGGFTSTAASFILADLSTRTYEFLAIGDELSSSEAISLNNIVRAYRP